MLLPDEADAGAFASGLHAAHDRESALARELGKVKAENAELQTKLQRVSASLKTAKVTAREALIEMADQNAKLVQAFVDKKRECKQLKASAREDRKAWQQRLQTMELELQSNKQHIQQLMQQLHAIAAKQVAIPQPDRGAAVNSALHGSSPPVQQRSRVCDAGSSSSSSSSMHETSTTSLFGLGASRPQPSQQQKQQQPSQDTSGDSSSLQGPSPLGDATNRYSSRWQQSSSTMFGTSPSSKPKGAVGSTPPSGGENSLPSRDNLQPQPAAAGLSNRQQWQQQEEGAGQLAQPHDQQQQQQRDDAQLVDVQRQMQELQQRAQQLEAENAHLKSAQAAATAQIDNLKLLQQAEQLKQQGNRHFQAQEYQAAAAAYSQALALEAGDASLTTVLLCNRAAAQHAAGQYLDAIADCCLAHELDAKYPRALQRRAETYMAVQHYSAAVADLQALLEQAAAGSSKEVAARLASAQAKQRTHGSVGPNHYLILGLEAGAAVAEVKAAYKRLALRHHPDKTTGQQAKAAAEVVFVLITAANSVLSDPSKRAAYDAAYARSSLLYCGLSSSSHYAARPSSSSHRHASSSSSTGMGTGAYSWQQHSAGNGYAAAAAAAAAARPAAPSWQHSAFRSHAPATAAPTDTCNSGNSSSSCASGTSYGARTTAAGGRF